MWANQQALLWTSPPATADFNLNAVDFDGSTEYMANTSVSFSLWANTVSVWIEPSMIATWWDEDKIIAFQNSSSQNLMYIQFYQGKFYAIYWVWWISWVIQPSSPLPVIWNKFNIVLRHTWATNWMSMWINWTSAWTSTWTAVSWTVTKVYIWSTAGSLYYWWKVSRVDYWDTNISDASVSAIYDSWNWYKLDLRNSIWSYTETSNLKHQWCLWKDSWNIWADYVSSWNIDLMTNAVNITSGDIVTF